MEPTRNRVVATLLVGLAMLTASPAPAATPTAVPTGHPRVYLRAADLPAIKAKLTNPEFATSWTKVKACNEAVCRAFVYLVQGDKTAGDKAVADALTELKACTNARTFDTCMHHGAVVYDWCYPLLSSAERSAYITELKRIAGSHSPGYPAKLGSGAVVGHNTEGWLLVGQLPAGVAIYDELPAMYDAAAKLYFDEFVPVRDFLYPAHMHHQGDSYISARFQHDLASSWLFRRMGGGDVLSTEQRYVPYQLIYNLRPDGQQLRSGDTYDDRGKSNGKRRLMALAGAYYKDPYLLTMADYAHYWSASNIDHVLRLVLTPAGAATKPISELAQTKYFPPPMGEMVARTGWKPGVDSADTVVQMRVGGTFFGNHQRKDFGTFQIYHRGPLAISSGVYEGATCQYGSTHWKNYYHQTIAHNGLLILDPAEKMILSGKEQANDGGQRWPNGGKDHPADLTTLKTKGYKLASVTAHQVGPTAKTPEYSYIAGDITAAYAPAKASRVTRSMVTLRTASGSYPAVVVVYDRVTATKAAFKKTWLLHSVEQPTIKGRTITVVRSGPTHDNKGSYGGKLVAESLLPAQATLTALGGPGKAFWIESAKQDFACSKGGAAEPGAWRVEVSPSAASAADTFLHVLSAMKSTTASGPAVALVQGSSHQGAAVLDRIVLFGRAPAPVSQADVKLPAAASGGSVKVLLCDLKAGSYAVKRDGGIVGYYRATTAGGCIYFAGGAGSYAVAPGAPLDGGAGSDASGTGDSAGPGADGQVNADGNAGSGDGGGSTGGKRADDGCGCQTGGAAGAPVASSLLLLLLMRRRGGGFGDGCK